MSSVLQRFPALWILVLTGPVVWSCAFAVWLGVSLFQCSTVWQEWLPATGAIALGLTLLSLVLTRRASRAPEDRSEQRHVTRFLIGLAVGAAALFAQLILLSIVPMALLKGCPP